MILYQLSQQYLGLEHMKRNLIPSLAIFILLGGGDTAQAGAIESACGNIWKKKQEIKKCVDHVKLFEVPLPFLNLCRDKFKDQDDRWNCVKSGATADTFKQCVDLQWNTANTLTCLRTLQVPGRAESCRLFSLDEEVQVACLRTGRESAQISACSEWGVQDSEKLDCLKMDIPAEEIRTCVKRTKNNVEAAKKCLLNFVANREKIYRQEMAEATREILAREELEKTKIKGTSNRMPASVKSTRK